MKTTLGKCFTAILCLVIGWPMALAQSEMDDAVATVEGMFAGISEFAGDVRFDASDVESLIELWDDYAVIGEEDDDEDDAIVDFEALLNNAEYRDWTAAHGLDADDWLRKAIRITMVLYREQMLANAAELPRQFEQQVAEIEAQRAQMGEEMYQQLMESLEMGRQYSEQMMAAAHTLPEPTAAESKVLDVYRDQLLMMMSADEPDDFEDDYYYEDGYEDGYEDDYEDGG